MAAGTAVFFLFPCHCTWRHTWSAPRASHLCSHSAAPRSAKSGTASWCRAWPRSTCSERESWQLETGHALVFAGDGAACLRDPLGAVCGPWLVRGKRLQLPRSAQCTFHRMPATQTLLRCGPRRARGAQLWLTLPRLSSLIRSYFGVDVKAYGQYGHVDTKYLKVSPPLNLFLTHKTQISSGHLLWRSLHLHLACSTLPCLE